MFNAPTKRSREHTPYPVTLLSHLHFMNKPGNNIYNMSRFDFIRRKVKHKLKPFNFEHMIL